MISLLDAWPSWMHTHHHATIGHNTGGGMKLSLSALWDCVPRVRGGEGGGLLLGAVPALSWCGEVSLGGKHIIHA